MTAPDKGWAQLPLSPAQAQRNFEVCVGVVDLQTLLSQSLQGRAYRRQLTPCPTGRFLGCYQDPTSQQRLCLCAASRQQKHAGLLLWLGSC